MNALRRRRLSVRSAAQRIRRFLCAIRRGRQVHRRRPRLCTAVGHCDRVILHPPMCCNRQLSASNGMSGAECGGASFAALGWLRLPRRRSVSAALWPSTAVLASWIADALARATDTATGLSAVGSLDFWLLTHSLTRTDHPPCDFDPALCVRPPLSFTHRARARLQLEERRQTEWRQNDRITCGRLGRCDDDVRVERQSGQPADRCLLLKPPQARSHGHDSCCSSTTAAVRVVMAVRLPIAGTLAAMAAQLTARVWRLSAAQRLGGRSAGGC